ncbi:LOW QUALITY PROTEIN: hypothetical protein CRUP_029307 [Coryphaenoides rupestris]|nr:LOW QUALITY PROTEIN: hypothetical protein CRUP_029307 [Coryphaenoides rupestris]
MQAFLPPDSLPGFSQESSSKQDNVFCGQLQRFQSKSINERGLHSWHAENCYKKFPFICKRKQTCVDIKDNVVIEGYYFTPKGDDPCLSCTCHDGEPEMCVAALGMRLIVSCISSFLILSLLLFMVHRLRQRRRERIETLIGGNLHHFNLGRRVPGFDCGPNAFGTGLTPLHLSDDGDGGAFHFQEPPPPYAAYKYPDLPHPDDPPPPYEASIDPDSLLYMELARSSVPVVPRHHNTAARCLQPSLRSPPCRPPAPPPPAPGAAPQRREDSVDSSTHLVAPDTPNDHGHAPDAGLPLDSDGGLSLSTVV